VSSLVCLLTVENVAELRFVLRWPKPMKGVNSSAHQLIFRLSYSCLAFCGSRC